MMEEAAEIAKLVANTTALTAQLEELSVKHEKSVEELARAHMGRGVAVERAGGEGES